MGTPGRASWPRRLLRQAAANARANPYLAVLFGFWAFGYTMMVPTLLGSRFMAFISERLGGAPETLFVAFGALLLNVFVFAGVVPFVLWMLVCWALHGEK
ncbi:MAG: hypothetical protein HZA24_01625 [Nitrospirae bacterium]|nr:hypothetical protein [Nitrospirota bacterium]